MWRISNGTRGIHPLETRVRLGEVGPRSVAGGRSPHEEDRHNCDQVEGGVEDHAGDQGARPLVDEGEGHSGDEE